MKAYLAAIGAVVLLASASAFAQSQSTANQQSQSGQQAQQSGEQQGQKTELSQPFVRQIQSHLRQQGYYDNKPNGEWDEDTADAVQQFQEENGLQPTGQLDGRTIIVLLSPAGQAGQGQRFLIVPRRGSQQSQGGIGSGSSMMPGQMGQMMGQGEMSGEGEMSGQGSQSGAIEAYQSGYQQGFQQGLQQRRQMRSQQRRLQQD